MHQVYLSRSQCGGISGLAILVLVMLCIFLALGTWQLQRKAEKEGILRIEQAGAQSAAENIPLGLQDYSQWRYRPVVADGQYVPEKQFLLDNQIRDRAVGYNAVSYTHLTLPTTPYV